MSTFAGIRLQPGRNAFLFFPPKKLREFAWQACGGESGVRLLIYKEALLLRLHMTSPRTYRSVAAVAQARWSAYVGDDDAVVFETVFAALDYVEAATLAEYLP